MTDESELEESWNKDNDEDDDKSMLYFKEDEEAPSTPPSASWHQDGSQDSMDSMEIDNYNSSSNDIITPSGYQPNQCNTEQAQE